MTERSPRRRQHWRLGPSALVARPRLIVAAAVGVAVGAGFAMAAPQLRAASNVIAGWDAFCYLFLGLTLHALRRKGPAEIRLRAAQEDQGQAVLLLVILAACVASVAAVALELSLAHAETGWPKSRHVAVGVVTLAGSWLLMQVIFALHYAHEYYAADPGTGQDAEGLEFPGGQDPDYWDFLYFSIVIGVAAQTADVAFTRREMRRLGAVHGLIAFAFNTLILALAINLVANLF